MHDPFYPIRKHINKGSRLNFHKNKIKTRIAYKTIDDNRAGHREKVRKR